MFMTIPRTDLSFRPICLGTAGAGVKNSETEVHRLWDMYLDLGGSFFDTARVYSDWVPGEQGRSERILGDWMASKKSRHGIIVATKGGHPPLSDLTAPRLSYQEIVSDVDASLTALRTDIIDLYYLHRDDRHRPVGEIMETLNDLVRQGKVKYLGCSNWEADRISEAQQYAHDHGLKSFVANQMLWNIGSGHMRPASDPLIVSMDAPARQLHRNSGFAAIPFSSQANGYFSKIVSTEPEDRAKAKQSRYHTPANLRIAEKLHGILPALPESVTMTRLILLFLLQQPFPVVPLVGCYTPEYLRDSFGALDLYDQGMIIEWDAIVEIEES